MKVVYVTWHVGGCIFYAFGIVAYEKALSAVYYVSMKFLKC